MGHEGRAGVNDGKDGDEDDQVDVSYLSERKTAQHWTELKLPCRRKWDIYVEWKGVTVRVIAIMWRHVH